LHHLRAFTVQLSRASRWILPEQGTQDFLSTSKNYARTFVEMLTCHSTAWPIANTGLAKILTLPLTTGCKPASHLIQEIKIAFRSIDLKQAEVVNLPRLDAAMCWTASPAKAHLLVFVPGKATIAEMHLAVLLNNLTGILLIKLALIGSDFVLRPAKIPHSFNSRWTSKNTLTLTSFQTITFASLKWL